MANELIHTDVGAALTQTEYHAVTAHSFNSQATGDVMYASSATQLTRLAKGAANTVLVMGASIPAWSATLAGLTLTSPTINGTIATTGLTLPAVTLGGAIAGGGQTATNLGGADIGVALAGFIGNTVDPANRLGVYTDGVYIQTNNASATAVTRLLVGEGVTAVATWSAVTHSGMVMSDHLTLHITDTDGATEGDIWYDASEDKLKFKTAAGVETITSV